MAVTPPAGYEPIAIGPGGPFGSAQLVEAASLADVLDNHNHLYAALGTPIGMQLYGLGLAAGAPWADVGIFWRPADPDQRTLTALVYYRNADGSDHTLRITDGSTTQTATATASTTGWATISWVPDSAAASEFVLQGDHADLAVFSTTVHRAVITGPFADDPLPSGFKWAQSAAESAADEPVSVEMMNRMLEAPRKIEVAQPVSLMCLSDSANPRMGITDVEIEVTLLGLSIDSGEGPHAILLGGISRRVTVTIHVAGWRRFNTLDGTVTLQLGSTTRVVTFAGGTSAPAAGGPYQWQTATDIELEAGMYSLLVSCRNMCVVAVNVLTG